MAMKIRKGDLVQIISGAKRKDSNGNPVQGRVLAVYPDEQKIIVEGYHFETKAAKPRQVKDTQIPGGLQKREGKIHVSKVMLLDEKNGNKPTRVGYRLDKDGMKERYAKRSGNALG